MNLRNKDTADKGKNQAFMDDAAKLTLQFMMPFVAKMVLNLIPRDKWQTIVSDKKKLWETATVVVPFGIMRLTNLAPFYDDLISNFFEEVKQEIGIRERGMETKKSEREIKANLLDLLANEPDRDVILDNYVDVFSLAITHHQHHNLVEFLNTLRPAALLSLLRMEKTHRDKFIILTIGVAGKEHSSFVAIIEGLKEAGTTIKALDDKFAPGGELDARITRFISAIEYTPRQKSFSGKVGHFVVSRFLKFF